MDRKLPLGVALAFVAILLVLVGMWWRAGAGERAIDGRTAQVSMEASTSPAAVAQVGALPKERDAAGAPAPFSSPYPPTSNPSTPASSADGGANAGPSGGGGSGAVPPPIPPGAGAAGGAGEPPRRGALADADYRARRVAELDADNTAAFERARRWAEANNEPMRIEENGRVVILVDYTEEGGPVYVSTFNVSAAISTATDLIRNVAPYNLNGNGIVGGIWDGGNVRATHTEFLGGRVTNANNASLDNHATHVAATMIARGANADALGMAPAAQLLAHDFENDLAEMTARAMAAPGESGKVQVSNHSYGSLTGWDSRSNSIRWYGSWGNRESDNFGRYATRDRDRDKLAYEAPYYLPFISAGNDRKDDAPASGVSFQYYSGGSWVSRNYNPSTDPYSDGWKNGGYDTLPYGNLPKNAVVVGAVDDAVTNGRRDLAGAGMTTFSSWGATDDGRIKPDIVANGEWLYSAGAGSDSDYYTTSGTSMSAPNASGSALLLLQHWANLFPGKFMWNSTIKALIIHTADALDGTGPNYRYGWGLMNAKAAADHISLHAARPDVRAIAEDVLNASRPVVEYSVLSGGDAALKATVVWTDPPGLVRTGLNDTNRVLVNDLDLRIVAPDGTTTHFPWVLNPASPALAATSGDNIRDNVEQVHIPATQSGIYKVRINHKGALSGGQQHFSLLVSGFAELAPPDAVTGVTANARSSTMVDLKWAAAARASSYKVLRGGVHVATVSNRTAFRDVGLAPFTDYVYRIVAVNYRGDSQPSEPAYVRTREWIDDHPFALLVTNPATGLSTSAAGFSFAGLVGQNVSSPLSWSNRLTGQTGVFGWSGFAWNTTVPLATGANLVDFRGTYTVRQGADSGDSADYADGWDSGDAGGSAFQPWLLQIGEGGEAFVRSDTNQPGARIFGLWSGSASSAVAVRPFPALTDGGAVALRFKNSGLAGTGRMGFEFTDAEDRPRLVFHSAAPGRPFRLHDGAGTNDTAWSNSASFASLKLTVSGEGDTYTLALNGSPVAGLLLPGGAVAKLKIFSEAAAEDAAYRFTESMQYALGSSLAGRNGGTGFSGAWTGGSSTMVAGPAPYPAWVRIGTNYSTRLLASPVTTGTKPIYFSMVMHSPDFTAGDFCGFALTQSNNPVNDIIFFGIPWTKNGFGLDLRQSGLTSELITIPNLQTSTPHLVVCGLIPGSVSGRVDVKMWVTTNTAQDVSTLLLQAPAINLVGSQGKLNFTFNQVKLVGNYAGALELAELKSFDAVRPRESYELLVKDLGWESDGFLSAAPVVVAVAGDSKTDGIPNAWWNEHAIPPDHRLALADWDRDGLSNLIEYFAGLDPTSVDVRALFSPDADAGVAYVDYRRSKLAGGVRGAMVWTSDLGSRLWSSDGVTDVVLEDYPTYEIRRARVPWQQGDAPVFLRLGVTPESE